MVYLRVKLFWYTHLFSFTWKKWQLFLWDKLINTPSRWSPIKRGPRRCKHNFGSAAGYRVGLIRPQITKTMTIWVTELSTRLNKFLHGGQGGGHDGPLIYRDSSLHLHYKFCKNALILLAPDPSRLNVWVQVGSDWRGDTVMATRKGHSNFMAVQGEPTNPEWQLDLITSNSMKHGGGEIYALLVPCS